ncbi:MAG: serine hydrolase domain-containing protein [bacterium]
MVMYGILKEMGDSMVNINEKKTGIQVSELGFISENIIRLDQHFQGLIDKKILQCAGYLLSKDGKIFAHKSMGYLRTNDKKKEMMPDSIRRIASITKLFTATAIMQLVEKGLLRIDQTVRTILEEFDHPLFESVSIFHLLTHTSGLHPDPGAYFEPYPDTWDWYEKENWIEEILRGHTRVDPGKEWSYSSACFIILGEIIRRISGIKYEQYVKENILDPLGMEDSFFYVPEDKISRICLTNDETEEDIRKWMKEYKSRPDGSPSGAGGGMFSTLEDLNKYANMILNNGEYNGNRILSRKSVERMTRNQLDGVLDYCWENNGVERSYGLGFRVQKDFLLITPGTVSHEGAGLSALYIDRQEKLAYVMFGPLYKGVEWDDKAVFNPINIVWSGLI